MPRNSSTGVSTLPSPSNFNPAVPGQIATAADWNATAADIIAQLTHAPATTRALYPTAGQVQDEAFAWCGAAGGTADALTLTPSPAIMAYAAGQRFSFLTGGANNTGPATVAVSGLAATNLRRSNGGTLAAGDLPAHSIIDIRHDGTAFRIVGVTATQASPAGGAMARSSAVDLALTANDARLQIVTMTTDAKSVVLPDARGLSLGGPVFAIRNGGSRPFGVRANNPSILINGDFAVATGWTTGTGWSIASGAATKTAGTQADLTQAAATAAGTDLVVTYTVTSISGGTVRPILTNGGADVLGTARNAPGTYTERLVSNGNTTAGLRGDASFAGTIDNITITPVTSALVAAVEPGGVAEMYLEDNATAAGAWTVTGRGLLPALTICDETLPSTLTQTVEVAVRLTDTLSLHFARNASGHPFVFAVDHGTYPATVGTAVLIVASNVTVEHAFRVSDTKAFFKIAGTSSNVYNVTVSGTTCTVSSAATAAVFDAATFTAEPVIAALGANNDLLVALDVSGGAVRAQAVDASGANPVAGSSVNIVASGGQTACALYRVTATTALALYVDDSGTAGTPFSIRGVVLSLSGTTITVGTSAGVNDVAGAVVLPSCQLSATSYIVSYTAPGNPHTDARAVHVGVSGTAVTFGTPLLLESGNVGASEYTTFQGSRFQPNAYAIDATRALLTYAPAPSQGGARHVIVSNNAGTLTAGSVLFSLFSNVSGGGNLPQGGDGFLALNPSSIRQQIVSVTINGASLNITGNASPPGAATFPSSGVLRFGLSGGVRGIALNTLFAGRLLAYRFRANTAPLFLGALTLPNSDWGTSTAIPVELAPSRAAFTALSIAQAGSTTSAVRLAILEFAA